MTTDRLPPQLWMTAAPTVAVLDALEAAGGPGCARFVGGCVRDALLGRPVADVDIATVLEPRATMAALRRAGLTAAPTGIEHGTVTAVADHRPFEITTLRRDVETDGRRAVVAFTTDWAEDAGRRDFRLNGLYADREGRLYDPIGGGVDDALAGRIVFVGEAGTRIREDYLRILRFFRFSAWYGRGEPDATALKACAALKAGIETLSGERLSKEMLKLLAAPDPRRAVRWMQDSGVLGLVLSSPLESERFGRMVPLADDAELRLAALLPDEAPAVGAVATRLRLSNATRDRLLAAVEAVDLGWTDAQARAAIYRVGAAAFRDRALKAAAETGADAARLLKLGRDWSPPKLPVGGADAVALGLSGPAVGQALRALEDWWIDHDFAPDRAALLAELRARAGS